MEQRTPLIQTFLAKNKQINLSAIRDEKGVWLKHIQDALEIYKVVHFPSGATVADLGTGGGFPLLPLALTSPDGQFIGIDSIQKKTLAVNEMIATLHIPNAQVVWSRIEDYPHSVPAGYPQTFDYLTARAVAYVDKLIPWAYPLLKPGGTLILMKQYLVSEKKDLEKVCKIWKLQLTKEHHYSLFP
ncbi:MAG: 16S rRNA (guanine(527)-N(7))-methyltransferase RsmG [Candidatus Peribacteria bacterium]|jgi:16S rRNA (guanine527-N7)-methyltransferase|nr:16S rRNA (guanine(527)-N(7))-methyltransferase RsmG [Candidatus Peribacteria bacterium]